MGIVYFANKCNLENKTGMVLSNSEFALQIDNTSSVKPFQNHSRGSSI